MTFTICKKLIQQVKKSRSHWQKSSLWFRWHCGAPKHSEPCKKVDVVNIIFKLIAEIWAYLISTLIRRVRCTSCWEEAFVNAEHVAHGFFCKTAEYALSTLIQRYEQKTKVRRLPAFYRRCKSLTSLADKMANLHTYSPKIGRIPW